MKKPRKPQLPAWEEVPGSRTPRFDLVWPGYANDAIAYIPEEYARSRKMIQYGCIEGGVHVDLHARRICRRNDATWLLAIKALRTCRALVCELAEEGEDD